MKLIVLLLFPLFVFLDNTTRRMELESLANRIDGVAFYDDFGSDWQDKWHLDGKKAKVVLNNGGLEMYAGCEAYNDEDHAVLWTKKEFGGNLMIEYDFVRLDSSKYHFVNIIYIQATGSGAGRYARDIFKWNCLRNKPKMSTYYDNMNLYHISYAVTPVPSEGKFDYIRARRYMPDLKNGLKGAEMKEEYINVGLFEVGIKYHIRIIKYGTDLYMNVEGDGRDELFYFDASGFPEVDYGRIGLRQMYTRNSRYENFVVYNLK